MMCGLCVHGDCSDVWLAVCMVTIVMFGLLCMVTIVMCGLLCAW